jgi:hypothetical protein
LGLRGISTPEGDDTLTWNAVNVSYQSLVYSVIFESGSWKLYELGRPGSFVHDFEVGFETGISCWQWPTGYSFKKKSGVTLFYKILKIDHNVDEYGGYHHTRLECELQDKDNLLPA